jgi:hypothetical protein
MKVSEVLIYVRMCLKNMMLRILHNELFFPSENNPEYDIRGL